MPWFTVVCDDKTEQEYEDEADEGFEVNDETYYEHVEAADADEAYDIAWERMQGQGQIHEVMPGRIEP